MLRVTVELLPAGRAQGRQTLGTAGIGRIWSGGLADYQVDMEDGLFPEQIWSGALQDYPRWSASVWDLVVRSIAVALTGKEELPPRPHLPQVSIHTFDGGLRVVRLDEIPEPTRTFFQHNLRRSGTPGAGMAFAWDWGDFPAGQR